MDPLLIVVVVLLSVLVGATLPVWFQLYSTLRDTRRLLGRFGPKLDATLADLNELTRRTRATMPELEQSAKRANQLLHEATEMTRTLRQLRRSIKIASAVAGAVGPALAAAVQGWVEQHGARRATDASSDPDDVADAKPEEPQTAKGDHE